MEKKTEEASLPWAVQVSVVSEFSADGLGRFLIGIC
jgi:hypothetical protein